MVPIVTMVVLMTLTTLMTLITSRAAIIVTVLALYQAATTGSSVASAEPSPYTQGMREPALMELVLPAPLADACDAWDVSALRVAPGTNTGWSLNWSRRVPAVNGVLNLNRTTEEAVLVVQCVGMQGYLLDGPSPGLEVPTRRILSPILRRTVRGPMPEGLPYGAIPSWIGSLPGVDHWPVCSRASPADWECVGVPLDQGGVVFLSGGGVPLCVGPGRTAQNDPAC